MCLLLRQPYKAPITHPQIISKAPSGAVWSQGIIRIQIVSKAPPGSPLITLLPPLITQLLSGAVCSQGIIRIPTRSPEPAPRHTTICDLLLSAPFAALHTHLRVTLEATRAEYHSPINPLTTTCAELKHSLARCSGGHTCRAIPLVH
eukprot:1148279-Pelagomonas_calceolata.AAC.1